jgi:acyl-CoA reductase-like NAD-dependent aldehyde dehydrogenase
MATIINPATEMPLAEIESHDARAVDEAVSIAIAAQRVWVAKSLSFRSGALRAIGDAVLENLEELAALETANVGKPISDSRDEIAGVASCFHYYAGIVDKIYGETIPVDGGIDFTFKEPIGVVGIIAPWNFPLPIASWNIAPALACGNTVIVKPAEITPLSTLKLGEIIDALDIVPGLVQVITGKGAVVGAALSEHPGIGKISFTGSTEAGRTVMRAAAGTMKRLTLELGGKSAALIFADADLDLAARSSVGAVFGNTGQDCCARSRIYVQRDIFSEFVTRFTEHTAALRIGDPTRSETQLGPLISASHRETVRNFLDRDLDIRSEATLPEGSGFWMAPCTIVDPPREHRVVTDEIFGPVATILPFDTESDAVEQANNTIYGLSGSLWTRDLARGLRVARQIQTGTLSVNSSSSIRIHTPFGGSKQSGFGRELGMAAIDGYTDLKNVFVSTV